MENQRTPQEQLDELERDRDQLRARLALKWWQYAAMGLLACTFLVGQLLLSESDWLLPWQGATLLAALGVWRGRERRLGMRLDPPPRHRWAFALYFVGGTGLAVILIVLSEAFDSRWPAVLGCVAIVVVGVLATIRYDRRHAPSLRDER